MRFKLTLVVDKRQYGSIIPINYQYEQSAEKTYNRFIKLI